MDKEDLKKLTANPQFISGIYNYCDRWCERCPLTSRCLNFAMGNEQFSDPETRDINNKAFWEELAETFRVTLDLLKETAERKGIDLDSIDTEEAEEEEMLMEELAKNHECCRAAQVYADMVDDCFDSMRDMFGQSEEEQNSEEWLEIPSISMIEEDTSFEDAVEVIRWYQHQIYVKLMRAIRGDLEERTEVLDEFPKDSDGSAKVALIAIDRSISAWEEIGNRLPIQKDDILNLQMHLYGLRRKTEKAFPDARAFLRPGFDKIDLNS